MKKIRIENYKKPNKNSHRINDQQFSVYFDSDKKFYFKSEIKLKKFLIILSKKLNDQIEELNHYYMQLFNEYRLIWPYINQSNDFIRYFDEIEFYFDRLYFNAYSDNYNFNLFNYLNKITRVFLELSNYIESENEKNKIYSGVNRVRFIKKRIEIIEQNINNINPL